MKKQSFKTIGILLELVGTVLLLPGLLLITIGDMFYDKFLKIETDELNKKYGINTNSTTKSSGS